METIQKAYDPKELAKKLKSKGLNIAEEAILEVINATSEWAEESAKLGQKPFVDGIVLTAGPAIKKFLDEQADKIDGEVG